MPFKPTVTLLYGPYKSHSRIQHRAQKLQCILQRLPQGLYNVEEIPSAHLNRLEVQVQGKQIFTCDIRQLPFNLSDEDDPVVSRIIKTIDDHVRLSCPDIIEYGDDDNVDVNVAVKEEVESEDGGDEFQVFAVEAKKSIMIKESGWKDTLVFADKSSSRVVDDGFVCTDSACNVCQACSRNAEMIKSKQVLLEPSLAMSLRFLGNCPHGICPAIYSSSHLFTPSKISHLFTPSTLSTNRTIISILSSYTNELQSGTEMPDKDDDEKLIQVLNYECPKCKLPGCFCKMKSSATVHLYSPNSKRFAYKSTLDEIVIREVGKLYDKISSSSSSYYSSTDSSTYSDVSMKKDVTEEVQQSSGGFFPQFLPSSISDDYY